MTRAIVFSDLDGRVYRILAGRHYWPPGSYTWTPPLDFYAATPAPRPPDDRGDG